MNFVATFFLYQKMQIVFDRELSLSFLYIVKYQSDNVAIWPLLKRSHKTEKKNPGFFNYK